MSVEEFTTPNPEIIYLTSHCVKSDIVHHITYILRDLSVLK